MKARFKWTPERVERFNADLDAWINQTGSKKIRWPEIVALPYWKALSATEEILRRRYANTGGKKAHVMRRTKKHAMYKEATHYVEPQPMRSSATIHFCPNCGHNLDGHNAVEQVNEAINANGRA